MSTKLTSSGIVAREQPMNWGRRRVTVGVAVACFVLSSFLVIAAGAGAAIWSIQRLPAPAGASQHHARECLAVGFVVDRAGAYRVLAMRWNGSSWVDGRRVMRIGAGLHRGRGRVGAPEVMEHWSGGGWSTGPKTDLSLPESRLDAVACTSSTACTVVGEQVSPSIAAWPLLASWNDHRWSVQPLRGQPLA